MFFHHDRGAAVEEPLLCLILPVDSTLAIPVYHRRFGVLCCRSVVIAASLDSVAINSPSETLASCVVRLDTVLKVKGLSLFCDKVTL